ncbi:MAG: HAD family phosphatase [Rhodobacteraceae bacterium]|nr:HAD family phosphatase [Paracoccaceae bacterium]
MGQIQAVVFDIGNVLIEWQPERFFDGHIGPEARARMFAEIDLHAMNEAVDRGAPFRATVYDWAARFPAWEENIRLWHDRWIDMASPAILQSVRLMRALQARGVPVFALTNFGDETYTAAEPHYPFLRDFDRAFISGRLKVTKPDPEIYAIVERESGVAPGALLFTDDRAENIAVAAERGWGTHLFEGPEGWAARLVAEGLLTEREAA